MHLAIVTPLPIEQQAILEHLSHREVKLIGADRYIMGQFTGTHHRFQIITQITGSTNENIALATQRIISHFAPTVVILAGVAGGVKDVDIGDVVIGTKYYGYESGKVIEGRFVPRPESGYYSKELIAVAESIAYLENRGTIQKSTNRFRVVFGPIAAGNKVVASTQSETYHLLKQSYNDTVAIEMEAAGFGKAMWAHPDIRFINIRGISDLLDGKITADSQGSQELASRNMAAIVFELVNQLDVSQFKIIGSMDIKELSRQIIELILPIVKMDGMQGMEKEPTKAANGTVRKLWAKVKPLFIEEYEALKTTPGDVDAQADARSQLRRALKGEEGLKRELEELVEKTKTDSPNTSVSIKNSKNVVQGSTVSAGGDFNLGDKNMLAQ